MKPKIAVEGSLSNVSQALKSSGYQVVDFTGNEMQGVSAVVITGEDDNIMGMEDIKTKVPVINAEGMTAEQIRAEIEKRFS